MGIFICRCGGGEETSDYDNIKSYEGETRLGQRHGKGVYYYADGSIYDGQWQWGKKHGHGTYTFPDGTKKIGFFYNDDYLGDTPGKLFSEEVRERDPAKPLMRDYSQLTKKFSQESSEELDRRRKEREERQKELDIRLKEREERQEARRRKREEIRKKYDL